MATNITSNRQFANYGNVLPSADYTAAEQAIYNIAKLTGWWEADCGLFPENGLRWFDKTANKLMTVVNLVEPGIQTASHGRPAVYIGYGIHAGGGSSGEFGELKV